MSKILKKITEKVEQLAGYEEIDVDVNKGCTDDIDSFYCVYAGTEYCVKESCGDCKLNNCRGCTFLKECIREGAI